MNSERIRAALTVRIVDLNSKAALMDNDVEYECLVQPEPPARFHPVTLATRIRQLAEMHFLYNFLHGNCGDISHLKEKEWTFEVVQFKTQ